MSAVISQPQQQRQIPGKYQARHKIRFVTAASLFDGHDAAINIMRRILQSSGAEVIHLGHNRSVHEIVTAAIQEDAQGIAVSSYQGGHVEFFRYIIDLLRERGGENIKVFGGGGGVIVPEEIKALHDYGVTRIFSPEDGQTLGLQGMINSMLESCDSSQSQYTPKDITGLQAGRQPDLARFITAMENGDLNSGLRQQILDEARLTTVPILGVTGTGGAGKSSLTDELIRRFRLDQDDQLNIAIIAIDPSRRKSGGALLGDRIRMNAIDSPNIYMRSLATRHPGIEVPDHLDEVIAACKVAGFDLVVVETSGIGQVTQPSCRSWICRCTSCARIQRCQSVEKIDMLDFADLVAINKFDRKGGEDALRDVRKQMQRNREAFTTRAEDMPAFGTIASHFNDDGVTALHQEIFRQLRDKGWQANDAGKLPRLNVSASSGRNVIVPTARSRYLAEIAATVRDYHKTIAEQCTLVRRRQQLQDVKQLLEDEGQPVRALNELLSKTEEFIDPRARKLVDSWPQVRERYSGDEYIVKVRDREIRTQLTHTSLSGNRIPKSLCRAIRNTANY
ncbi:MAG: cobalamin-dependent protein [Candidatus Competibacteraceae bacterium]